MPFNIGILALQGNYSQHATLLTLIENNKTTLLNSFKTHYPKACDLLLKHSVRYSFIRNKHDLSPDIDGLILPGGESSTMIQLLYKQELHALLQKRIEDHTPTLGTCAGCILLADTVLTQNNTVRNRFKSPTNLNTYRSKTSQKSPLACCNITVERNSYGRQIFSFFAESTCVDTELLSIGVKSIEGLFIRSPRITVLDEHAKHLFYYKDDPVIVQYQSRLLCTFHPEAVHDPTLHLLFLIQCANHFEQ